MGAGHGGAADGVGGRVGADPGGGDADSGSPDVHAGAVAGEVGAGVRVVSSTDGHGLKKWIQIITLIMMRRNRGLS